MVQPIHIIWILILIIIVLLVIDSSGSKHPVQQQRQSSLETRYSGFPPQPPSILKAAADDTKDWERDVKTNKSVRFSFSNDHLIDKDQGGTPDLDLMYVPAREAVPTDDPFACKAESSSLPFANPNPKTLYED